MFENHDASIVCATGGGGCAPPTPSLFKWRKLASKPTYMLETMMPAFVCADVGEGGGFFQSRKLASKHMRLFSFSFMPRRA